MNLNDLGNTLNEHFTSNKSEECAELISKLNEYLTNSEVSTSYIDSCILHIFNKENGILLFLKRVIHNPRYKDFKLRCVEFLHILVNICLEQIHEYLIEITETILPLVTSSAGAKEKQKVLLLIHLVISKQHFDASTNENVQQFMSKLYSTFFKCLQRQIDKRSLVQEQLLNCVGIIAKKFPAIIDNHANLKCYILNTLKKELYQTKKSDSVIQGCLAALSNILQNFPFNEENDPANTQTLYQCIKLLTEQRDKSRSTFRECLSLFSQHVYLFSNHLYTEAKWWHEKLLTSFSYGIEDKKVACSALDALYRNVFNCLSTRTEEEDKALFAYFMGYFEKILLETEVDFNEMQNAIQGLGYFAQTFTVHLPPNRIENIFLKIYEILENKYIINKEEHDDFVNLPGYLKTLTCIIKRYQGVNTNHVVILEQISIVLIKIFPRIIHTQHYLVIDAFILTLHQLMEHSDQFLVVFIEDVIYQGVMWTSSHRITIEANFNTQNGVLTYKNYLPFWKGILKIKRVYKYEKYNLNMESRIILTKYLFKELTSTLFVLIDKLNLEIKLRDGNLINSDLELAYEPKKPSDFVVFVNIVDFYRDIFEEVDDELFEPSMVSNLITLISKSTKHPFVSGFYKLLEVYLNKCDKLNTFATSFDLKNEDLNICYHSVCQFIQEIIKKIIYFKGDLQIACIQMILASPEPIVKEIFPYTVVVFTTLFDIGRGYLHLANLGLDTLQKWYKCIPSEDMEPFLQQVLPLLNSYLQSNSLERSFISTDNLKLRKSKQLLSKRKILIQPDSELYKVQVKIATFLGQLNSNLYYIFVNAGAASQTMTWNKPQKLKIILPFGNNTFVDLYLDKFIPRILELSLYSSNRQLKVVACELLHAVILYMLGTVHPMSPTDQENLNAVMEIVVKPIFKLACDIDQTVQQLFSTLCVQLIHYYSHPNQCNKPHATLITETLTDTVCDATDFTMRDFAGNCINEYLKWTIKQIKEDDLKSHPDFIEKWIKIINCYCVHSDEFKRLGSVLIFNNIYATLREESAMFNLFWIELLHSLVTNLSLCTNNDDLIGQLYQALNHIERGFVEKSLIFNKTDNTRRLPIDFQGSSLKDVGVWLFKQSSSTNVHCRRKCFDMFLKIAPLVTNCKSPQNFIRIHINSNIELILQIYESKILNAPCFVKILDAEKINYIVKWMSGIQCALDGYTFLLTNQLVFERIILTDKLLNCFKYFINNLYGKDINYVLNLFKEGEFVYNNYEKLNFEKLRNNITNKLVEFLSITLQEQSHFKENVILWRTNTLQFICSYTFEATSYYDINTLITLLNQMCQKVSLSILEEFRSTILLYVENIDWNLTTAFMENPVTLKQRHLLRGILILQKSEFSKHLNMSAYLLGFVCKLPSILIKTETNDEIIIKLHKTALEYCTLMLKLALTEESEFLVLTKILLDSQRVKILGKNAIKEKGAYIFETFKEVIFKYIIKYYEIFVAEVFNNFLNMFKYLMEALRYLKKRKQQFDFQKIVTISINKINDGMKYFAADPFLGIEFLTILSSLSAKPLYLLIKENEIVTDWVIHLLHFENLGWTKEQSLNFKSTIFYILPAIVGPHKEHSDKLRSAILSIQYKHFNDDTNSCILAKKSMLIKLLNAAETAKSSVLLSLFVEIFVLEPNIFNDEEFLIDNLKKFIRNQEVKLQLECLTTIFNLCAKNTDFSNRTRYIIARDVLVVLLQYCSYKSFEDFYMTCIAYVITILQQNKDYNEKIIVDKTICHLLAELLFVRIEINISENNTCLIASIGFPNDESSSKKLVKTVIFCLLNTFKLQLSCEVEKDLLRLFHCHSYNALASVISNTQSDTKFYNWLFSREENGNDILWSKIVDLDAKYSFDIEIDKIPKEKKKVVNIRNMIKINKRTHGLHVNTVKYLESQHLFDSTLSEDITQFDLSNTILRHQVKDFKETEEMKVNEISLDAIHINKNECMATICGLIEHIAEKNTASSYENLPIWMDAVLKMLTTDTTHTNIKIFLTKIIHNTQHVFKLYAKWFFNPIIKIILDGCLGVNLNFFVAELVFMLISWYDVTTPFENTKIVSDLLLFLMQNVDNHRQETFKYDLELIKLVVETWKNYLVVSYDFLFHIINDKVIEEKLDVGIQLCAILLCNNIAPWNPQNFQTFLMSLCKRLKSDKKTIYQPCAEVLGLSLNYLNNCPDLMSQLESFRTYSSKILSSFQNSTNKFAYCLQAIVSNYSPVADKFLNCLISNLFHVAGNFKCIYLKILLTRVEIINSYNELCSIDYFKLLSSDNFEVQMLTLEFIQKCFLYLEDSFMLTILKEMIKFVTNSFITCRILIFDILTQMYYFYVEKKTDFSKEIVKICVEALLQGLTDPDEELQDKIYDFWSNTDKMPDDVFNRIIYLLDTMYKADIEEHYICYSTFLLLNLTKFNEQFQNKFFNYSLHNCTFADYKLNSNWKKQYLSTVPLFTGSFKSQDINSINLNVLRATPSNLEFEPTQIDISNTATNLQYNSLATYTSSFSFTVDESYSNLDKDGFKIPVSKDINIFEKRRLFKSRSKQNRYFAHLESKKSLRENELRKERIHERERGIKIYRKYRLGEYPDIELSLSQIITPMQIIAKHDFKFARLLYTNMLLSILSKFRYDLEENESFTRNLKLGIETILNKSTLYIPNTIGTLLDVALQHPELIQFDPSIVTKVCQFSGLYSIGSLLLEKYVTSTSENGPPPKKVKGIATFPNAEYLKLAELYKNMDEWDTVVAIFKEKLNCNDTVVMALETECNGNWKNAQKLYAEVLSEDDVQERKDFYYESYLKCFARLSEWENVTTAIGNMIAPNDKTINEEKVWLSLWDNEWNQEKLLPWYLKAKLRNTLNKNSAQLFSSINDLLKNSPDNLEYLKSNFSEEMAMLWLLQNEFKMANYYINVGIDNFLNDWLHIDPLLVKIKINKITNIKNLLDTSLFIKIITELNTENSETILNDVLTHYQQIFYPHQTSLESNETLTIYRNFFIVILQRKLKDMLKKTDFERYSNNFSRCKFEMYLNLIESALEQQNYIVARNYIKILPKPSNSIDEIRRELCFGKILDLLAQSRDSPQEKLDGFIKSFSRINAAVKEPQGDSLCYMIKIYETVFDVSCNICKILSANQHLFSPNKKSLESLMGHTHFTNVEDVLHYNLRCFEESLQKCKNALENMMDSNNVKIIYSMANANTKLAYFMQKRGNLNDTFIKCVLRSMKLGSTEGRCLFPCLLNATVVNKWKDIFKEELVYIPLWMFLGWIPQLLANVDNECVFVISEILIKIANNYPQAIVYPYRLSKENYQFKSDTVGEHGTLLIKELNEILVCNGIIDEFLEAISCVRIPNGFLLPHINKLIAECSSKTRFEIVLKMFFDDVETLLSNFKYPESSETFYVKTIKKYKVKVEDLYKKNPTMLQNSLKNLQKEIESINLNHIKLSSYNSWLTNIQSKSINFDLEIPGQYTGEKPPLMQNHIKIMGFSQNVKDLFKNSLRRPLRITIIGHNAKEYNFLIKCGEDLRQDQRIQQIFTLMNNLLKSDPECLKRRYNIKTYQVVPLSNQMGIIEWMNDVIELKNFMYQYCEKENVQSYEKVIEVYHSWILNACPKNLKNDKREIFRAAAKTYNRDDVILKYRTLVQNIPPDILKKSFWNLSINSESFYALRQRFILSYSVMCVSHWLLGIGDRHLSNIMFNTQSGEAVGVDFGYAFGFATQILPVPELVPFRLTPHILNIFQPLNDQEVIQNVMIHCLRAFKNNSNVLLSLMDVFIKEPTLDWQKIRNSIKSEASTEVTRSWCPIQKIKHAEDKLNGASSMKIMIEELQSRQDLSADFISQYIEYIKGHSTNIRSEKDDFLMLKEQVRCLLDHATDENLLGRMYWGWEPWL